MALFSKNTDLDRSVEREPFRISVIIFSALTASTQRMPPLLLHECDLHLAT